VDLLFCVGWLICLVCLIDAIREGQVRELSGLSAEKKALEERYLAALEMLGERAERVSEMQLDVGEWKTLYKTQIVDLCQKVEALQTQNQLLQTLSKQNQQSPN